MPLPSNCAECGFRRKDQVECRRHAPGPVYGPPVRAFWAKVRDDQRCGEGDTNGVIIDCLECSLWVPLPPEPPKQEPAPTSVWDRVRVKKDPVENRENFGRCVRYAPSPSDASVHADHRVTDKTVDGCGDGKKPKEEEEDGSL